MKKPKRLQDRIVMHLLTWLLASVASLEYNVFIGTMLEKGRELEKWDLKNVELHVQDDGKTLKVFAREQEKF